MHCCRNMPEVLRCAVNLNHGVSVACTPCNTPLTHSNLLCGVCIPSSKISRYLSVLAWLWLRGKCRAMLQVRAGSMPSGVLWPQLGTNCCLKSSSPRSPSLHLCCLTAINLPEACCCCLKLSPHSCCIDCASPQGFALLRPCFKAKVVCSAAHSCSGCR